jgi:hypothetical protein
MKYVLDSSVALKWVLPEADSGKAIRLRDDRPIDLSVHRLVGSAALAHISLSAIRRQSA